MRIKFGLSAELIEMATREVSKSDRKFHSDCFSQMINRFPFKLKNDLLYNMFKAKLQKITFFKDLPADVQVVLGQALTPIVYTKGTRLF